MSSLTASRPTHLVLTFNETPIQFVADKMGTWMVSYQAVSTLLGYLGDAYAASRLRLKNVTKPYERQMRHPIYGDLVSMPGIDRILSHIEKNHGLDPARSETAAQIRQWLSSAIFGAITGFYGVCPSPSQARIEESHFDNKCNCDVNMQICPTKELTEPRKIPLWLRSQSSIATSIFHLWADRLGHRVYSATEVIEQASGILGFTDLLLEIASKPRDPDHVSPIRLGQWLVRHQSWTDGVLRVDSRRDTNKHSLLWAVRKVHL